MSDKKYTKEEKAALASFCLALAERLGDKKIGAEHLRMAARGFIGEAKHTCHFPTCEKECPPKMWGCKDHWFKLPKRLRDRVWATYRAGQEITKTPSAAYLHVAKEVEQWCLENPDTK